MNSGCICCSLVGDFGTSLKEVVTKYNPDRILIEPSGVGKLSDVIKAVQGVQDEVDIKLNSYTTVVDAKKCKMYMKNFGEFFDNQIQYAGAIIMSRTDIVDEKKAMESMELLRSINEKAAIITTPIEKLDGKKILEVMEHPVSLADELLKEEHEHHHHDHGDDCTCDCCCGHDHHHHDGCCGEDCHHDARPANAKKRAARALADSLRVLQKSWAWILLGVALAAALEAYVPLQSLSELIGGHTVLSGLIAALIGFPIHSDIFSIAPVLLLLMDLSDTVAMIFALAAMVISVPGVIMLAQALRPKAVAQYAGVLIVLTLLCGAALVPVLR